MHAIFIAFPNCSIWQVAGLQRTLAEANWTMRTLTLDGRPIRTDGGITIVADAATRSVFPRDIQLLLLAGGNVTDEVAGDPALHRFLRQFDAGRGWIAAIGQAVLPLCTAGLLGGRHVAVDETAKIQAGNKLDNAVLEDVPVSLDGNIITAQSHAVDGFASQVLRCILR